MTSDSNATVIYEQAVNERLRMFLRIEFLASQFEHHCNASAASYWDKRAAVRALLEFYSLLRQRNTRMDLIAELDQRISWLQMLRNTKKIDMQLVAQAIQQHQELRTQAHAMRYPLHQHLSDCELLNVLQQRVPLPGCTSEADQPLYTNWLHRIPAAHPAALREWYEPVRGMTDIVRTILDLIRRSADFSPAVAQRGWYEKQIETAQPRQMIRIRLSASSSFYPEISVTPKSFSIVFRDGGDFSSQHPRQIVTNIDFELACCLF